jgi:hypothetical protein
MSAGRSNWHDRAVIIYPSRDPRATFAEAKNTLIRTCC